jgi:hypothetical protein
VFVKKTLSRRRAQARLKMMERQHRRGYEKKPLTADEFNVWQNEQVWEALSESLSPQISK